MRRGIFARILAVLFVALGPAVFPLPASAATLLEGPKYILSNLSPDADNVFHDVSFTLPANGSPIGPRDWIQVTLPNFENLEPFTEMVGGFGSPQFGVSGKTLRVTNVTVFPGTEVGFIGAKGTNPPPGQSFNAQIRVTKGSVNGIVSHEMDVEAGATANYVTTTAIIESPQSAVGVGGFTSPGAFVTIAENDVAIGTTVANNDGSFNFSLTGLDPGDHSFSVSASDSQARPTSRTVVELFLISATATTVSGILLSPTITVDPIEINKGDPLTISGEARPNSQVTILTESPLRSYEATSDGFGHWTTTLASGETQTYAPGEYRARAVVQDDFGNRSIDSPTANFTVKQPQDADNPPPSCDISQGDLNCDGKTNLQDFSILLFHWKTNHKKADINRDGAVNLTDFSIMMFYFKR